jgi:hypothetical protein
MDDMEECLQCETEFHIDETVCPACGFDDEEDEEPVIPFLFAMYRHTIMIISGLFNHDV